MTYQINPVERALPAQHLFSTPLKETQEKIVITKQGVSIAEIRPITPKKEEALKNQLW